MDDDYFKGLNGQASHNSLSNTLGILQQEQENRLKKEQENFNKASHHIPTPQSTRNIENKSTTKTSYSTENDNSVNQNVKKKEITPEEAYGTGIAVVVIVVIFLFLMLLPIGLILIGVWAGIETFKDSRMKFFISLTSSYVLSIFNWFLPFEYQSWFEVNVYDHYISAYERIFQYFSIESFFSMYYEFSTNVLNAAYLGLTFFIVSMGLEAASYVISIVKNSKSTNDLAKK